MHEVAVAAVVSFMNIQFLPRGPLMSVTLYFSDLKYTLQASVKKLSYEMK